MRSPLIPLRTAITCLASALALAPIPVTAQGLPSEPAGSGFLWRAESSANTVYILGSVHLLNDQYYPLPAAMEAAFDDAEVIVFETDIGSSPLEAAQLLLEKASPEPGESLEEVLSPEAYALAQQHGQELGLPIDFFQGLEPWFFATSLTSFKLLSLGFTPDEGIDQYFYNRAQDSGKRILFLETIEQQANFFEQLSVNEQRQFTLQTLEEIDQLEGSFREIVTAWAEGNAGRMEEILLSSFENYPEMERIFIRDRNYDWLSELETYLQEDDDYLVIVGALHLVGANGLLELLRQRGYATEQL